MAKAGKVAQKSEDRYAERFPGSVPLHGGGDMYQWEKVGQELVGTFVGIKPYKNGHIANMQTEDGRVAFSAPTILADILSGVRPGSKIAIVFTGETPSEKKGRSATKKFGVWALDESGSRNGPKEEDEDEEEEEDED